MGTTNDSNVVLKQYEKSNNLNKRISIHDKYSVNKQGFNNWIYSNYKIDEGMKILELGCGTGTIWIGRDDINKASQIILSDLSNGMLEESKKNLIKYNKIEYQNINIEDIPYPDNTFDIVIANMMLYHVTDLAKGLSEVRRVLKDGGVFYTATYGENGIVPYLANLLSPCGEENKNLNKNFTLQNGSNYLNKVFNNVEKLEYIDSLRVTNVDDIIDYLYSLSSMTNLDLSKRDKIKEILINNMKNGVLSIPKEYGMFICK